METPAFTTPQSRRFLMDYLRNRRLSDSLHFSLAEVAVRDLEEALRLLQGIDHPCEAWCDEVQAFLAQRNPRPEPDASTALPGLLEGAS